jgi:FkbM family methyltransferase
MLTSKPTVSIGMPVYNGADYIEQAIDSLLGQIYQDFELIISDNCSTDATYEICLRYAAKDSRIKLYRNEENLGALSNFSKVLELARADYFMWAAHDDLWEPAYLSTLVDILNKDEQVVLAFVMFNSIDLTSQEVKTYPYILDLPADDICQRLSNYLNQPETLGKANSFYGLMRKQFTKEAFVRNSYLFESNVWASDMLFVFQMLSLGKFAVAPEILFHKRIISTALSVTIEEDWNSYFAGYEDLIKNNINLRIDQKQKLILEVFIRRISKKIQAIKFIMKNNILLSIKLKLSYIKIKSTLKYYLRTIYGKLSINKYCHISYSQCGEDLIIKYIFNALGIDIPSYIDIGAHHPSYLNNTAIFYLSGSKGINIEPDPILYKEFLVKRKNDINLNACIANKDGEKDFYFMSTPTLNTLSKIEADKYVSLGYSINSVIKLKTDTLSNIIKKHWNNIFPDLLSLDTEGMDEAILKSIDYEKNYPIVICVETISFSNDGRGIKNKSIIEFLDSKGYLAYADTNINTIFVRKDRWIRMP